MPLSRLFALLKAVNRETGVVGLLFAIKADQATTNISVNIFFIAVV
jgi:hypothetical protein